MTFGEYLKSLRKKAGITQRDLTNASGVSNAEVCRLETGERQKPAPSILKALAEPLNTTYEDLMEKAGYIEKTVPRGNYEDVVWQQDDGAFVDTYRRAVKNIVAKDSELISILDRALDKSSAKDIETIKKLLSGFMDGSLTDAEKLTLSTIMDSFNKK